MDLKIRDALPEDHTTIVAFNSRLADETEDHILDPALIGAGVAALLDDPSKGRYWVATVGGKLVGQIMVTYEWSDWRNGMFWWIQSVYIDAAFRRKGVFSALYRHVESLVKEDQNACGLRLYVEENNTKAQETYLNLNMTKTPYLVMESMLTGKQRD